MQWKVTMTDELYHHGILGMKWGVRRFQRKDGTWTATGKRRRELSPDAQKRANRKNEIKNLKSKSELETAKAAYKVQKAQNRKAVQTAKEGVTTLGSKIKGRLAEKAAARKEKQTTSNEDLIRTGDFNKIMKSKEKMTDDELRMAVNRLRLEQDLKDVNQREKDRGAATYKKFADFASNTATLTSQGINAYNNIARVINTFTGKDLKIIGDKKESGPSATERALQEARLRTARATADIAEANARARRHEEVQEGQRRAAEHWRQRHPRPANNSNDASSGSNAQNTSGNNVQNANNSAAERSEQTQRTLSGNVGLGRMREAQRIIDTGENETRARRSATPSAASPHATAQAHDILHTVILQNGAVTIDYSPDDDDDDDWAV